VTAGLDAYLICATPRTGSTLLCGLLESTGVAGHPESYFNRKSLTSYARQWNLPRSEQGLIDGAFVRAAVAAGSTPNGVFGARIMGETLPELLAALQALSTAPARSDLDLVTDAFGRTRFIHLRRWDVVAQAVSWARAEQTHFWHPGEEVLPGAQSPHYNRDLLERLAARVRALEEAWSNWFAGLGLVPHEIEYDDLARDPIGAARAALDFLGLDLPPDRSIEVRHHRQADDLNADWIARFRSG
jgi:trehalose 2-sulfotransferase